MKKVLSFIAILSISAVSCVKQEDFVLLQNQMKKIQKDVSSLKKTQAETNKKVENLAEKLDEVSNIAVKNSLEIKKLKLGYKPPEPENVPLEGEEKVKNATNPQDLYNQALDLYYQGKLEESESKFKEFIKKFKNSNLYDNALFWIGQIYYTKGEYKKAISTFDNLINMCESGQLKNCNKLPNAYLKIAYSYLKVGDQEKAKEYLQKIVEKFPNTEEAKIAQRKLEVLK